MQIISGSYKDEIGQKLAVWYTKKSGIQFYTVYTATGYLFDGEIKAVAIYTDFTGANIEVHLVANKVLSRAIIISILSYVFKQLNCVRCTVKIQRKNKYIVKTALRIGFEYECTLKSYYGLRPEQDALVYRMFRPQAEKWIK